MSALVEPSHEEPIGQLAARDRQVAAMAGQLAELVEVNEALAAKLALLEHGAERMLEGRDEQRRDHRA